MLFGVENFRSRKNEARAVVKNKYFVRKYQNNRSRTQIKEIIMRESIKSKTYTRERELDAQESKARQIEH